MELFKILGTVAVDGVDSATNGLEKVGNAAKKAGQVMAAGLAAGVTAIGALTKQSLDAYANYEQLVGGVETLFGTRGAKTVEEYAALVGKSVDAVSAEFDMLQAAQTKAMDNAAIAYQTAGMSANEYMETISGFAASLKQSTASELEAAEVADMAVQDMADNANKMGSTMESIQNAYQGFAKQNYTMLDNLKLGYGGTKEEMGRLLEDASKLSGIEYDISSLSDVYSAIHVVQEELGITGTTAQEASETISGSLAMTKAAWQNLLTGFADDSQDLGVLIDNLVDSATTAVHNLVPRIAQILSGISKAMTQIMPIITAELPGILQELLPGLIDGAVALINGLVASLPAILGILIEQFPSIFMQISQGLIQTFPVLLDTVKNLFGQIFDYISLNLLNTGSSFQDFCGQAQTLFQGLWTVVQTVWETIGQPIFDALLFAFQTVYDTFALYWPEITAFAQKCFQDIQTFWTVNLKPCFEAIGNFIRTVLAPVFQSVFLGTIVPLIQTVFSTIQSLWETVLKPVFTGITDFLTGVFTTNWKQAFEGLVSIVKGVVNGVINGIETMINGAISAVNGLIEGLNKLISIAGAFLGLGSLKIPTIGLLSLPRLEEGGILEKGQVGLLEGKGAEAVVPLDQNRKWISAVAEDMAGAGIGGNSEQAQRIIDLLEALIEMLPDTMKDAFASMKFDVNNREFARMVKAVG